MGELSEELVVHNLVSDPVSFGAPRIVQVAGSGKLVGAGDERHTAVAAFDVGSDGGLGCDALAIPVCASLHEICNATRLIVNTHVATMDNQDHIVVKESLKVLGGLRVFLVDTVAESAIQLSSVVGKRQREEQHEQQGNHLLSGKNDHPSWEWTEK